MNQGKIIDHLFRHQSGKMVSILTRIFGLRHLETIEDAVQDTFIKAAKTWHQNPPDNPEAWLTAAAKNRVLDLFRKLKSDEERLTKVDFGASAIALDELFLDHEIEDSQLRMIFTACNPSLDPRDQIAFALKTISGFSTKEIAAALLLKDETVKKRLSRARKTIADQQLKFEIPAGKELSERLTRALEVIYLIFNEGFHSMQQDVLVREDLCQEAMRLITMMRNHKMIESAEVDALFALFCFHLARLASKVNAQNEIMSLKQQDRNKWDMRLIFAGNLAMHKAVATGEYSAFHYEAAIASEHVAAKTFEETNWKNIVMWYERLNTIKPSDLNQLSIAMAYLQQKEHEKCNSILAQINPSDLEQRAYLFYGLRAEYFAAIDKKQKAVLEINQALELVTSQIEKDYLIKKKHKFTE